MQLAGLVSGGKDSCYNLMQCIAAGHEIVALVHLAPKEEAEMDSYMYQSVGSSGVSLYAEAIGVPLYRRVIKGRSLAIKDINYEPTEGDEVEDLYSVLKEVKEQCHIEGVSVGAILSDYQRIRVENVCNRLGLVCLAYLWRRDQIKLLREMVQCGVEAVIIKVAAVGLEPKKHLGKNIREMLPHLEKMKDKFNLHVCGEGGEYETFTVDCPIFRKRIVLKGTCIHESPDNVGYLTFTNSELVDKENSGSASLLDLVTNACVPRPDDFLTDLHLSEEEQQAEDLGKAKDITSASCDSNVGEVKSSDYHLSPTLLSTSSGFLWSGSVVGKTVDEAIGSLKVNPPVRVCVQVPLHSDTEVQLDVTGYRETKIISEDGDDVTPTRVTMHVQSISHWAPANIGPYSQAVKVGSVIMVAGMIGLVPGTMQLVEGGLDVQARLALRHVSRVVAAISPNSDIRSVVQAVCFVTRSSDIETARRMMARVSQAQISTYVVVPALPRGALIEWQTWAAVENNKFEYEEKGYTRGGINVRLRRRWHLDNLVCAVITTVSRSCNSDELVSGELLVELIEYTLAKAATRGQGEDLDSPVTNGSLPHQEKAIFLTFYYRVGAVDGAVLGECAAHALEGRAVFSVVPVLAVEDANTVLAVTAARH